MKKTPIIYLFCLMSSFLGSCDFIDKNMPLIEVDSITLKDLEGTEYVIDSSWDYLDVISLSTDRFNRKTLIAEIDSKIKRPDGIEETTKGTVYRKDVNTIFYDFETKHQNGETAFINEYTKNIIENNERVGQNIYCKYQYNSEQAFSGLEYMNTKEEKNNNFFYSEEYPTQPPAKSKLSEMYVSYTNAKGLLTKMRLYNLYGQFMYINENHEKILCDFDAHYKGSYKLYKDCIIFEEETPFPMPPIGSDTIKYNYYKNSLDNGYLLKKTIKYNYVTNTLDYVKYEGTGIFNFINPSVPMTIEATITCKTFNETKFNEKVDELRTFIYDNTIVRNSN